MTNQAICADCGADPAHNPLSTTLYHDWSDDPNSGYCFHCTAKFEQFQHNPPGDFPGADPRFWNHPNQADNILTNYHSANFALMVAQKRCDHPAEVDLTRYTANEKETQARLDAAAHFLATGDYTTARFIILPIGQPNYFDFGIPIRPFAFSKTNRERLLLAWQAIQAHAATQLQALLNDENQ